MLQSTTAAHGIRDCMIGTSATIAANLRCFPERDDAAA